MQSAKSITTIASTMQNVVSRKATAEQVLGGFTKNNSIHCLTFGQFSLIDALVAVLRKTGKADVIISTWTAAHAHLDKTEAMLLSDLIGELRLIVDHSFRNRQPEYFEQMIRQFGENCIRETKTHAKYIVVRNKNWNVVINTSMNLNNNPRLENIIIQESKELSDFYTEISEDIFKEPHSRLPALSSQKEFPLFKVMNEGLMDAPHEMGYVSVMKKNGEMNHEHS